MEYLVLTDMFLTQIPSKLAILKHLYPEFLQYNLKILKLGQTKLEQRMKTHQKGIG